MGCPRSNLFRYQEIVLGSWNSGYINWYQYGHYMHNLMHNGYIVSEPQHTEVHMAWIQNLKKYVVYTKSVPVFVSVNLFFSVCKHHGYSRNAFCDKIFTYEEYTERISTLSPMLEYREEQINRSRDRNCLFVKKRTFWKCVFTLCALQCVAVPKRCTRCASNFACNVHIDTRWCTQSFKILGLFPDTERDYFWDAPCTSMGY